MTAELALALPSVVLVLAVVICVGRVVAAQLRCADAARAGARLAARGEPAGRVTAEAARLLPAGGRALFEESSGQVIVHAEAAVNLPLPGGPSVHVGSHATAQIEAPSGGQP